MRLVSSFLGITGLVLLFIMVGAPVSRFVDLPSLLFVGLTPLLVTYAAHPKDRMPGRHALLGQPKTERERQSALAVLQTVRRAALAAGVVGALICLGRLGTTWFDGDLERATQGAALSLFYGVGIAELLVGVLRRRVEHAMLDPLGALRNPAGEVGLNRSTLLWGSLGAAGGVAAFGFTVGFGEGPVIVPPPSSEGQPVAEVMTSPAPHQLTAGPDEQEVGEPGWRLSGGGGHVYAVSYAGWIDGEDNDVWRLFPIDDTYGRYGTWMRSIDVSEHVGERVRVTAQVRSVGAIRRADFWSRVQAPASPPDGGGLGGDSVDLRLSTDWTTHSMVFDVPESGDRLQYGFGLAGPGTLRFTTPTLEVVPADTPLTLRGRPRVGSGP